MSYTHRSHFPKDPPLVKTAYCFVCGADRIVPIERDGRRLYRCDTCSEISERVRVYDPTGMIQRFNEQGELVHESAGIVVQNEKKEILLFLRKKYPFLYTVPAGHISPGEDPKTAGIRETFEEVGCVLSDVELLFEGEVRGDSCVGGADIHYWHLYLGHVDDIPSIALNEEGSSFEWFSFDDIPKNITYPVAFFFTREEVRSRLRGAN